MGPPIDAGSTFFSDSCSVGSFWLPVGDVASLYS